MAALGERAKPRIIATLANFVLWCAKDEPDRNIELSPQMQKYVDDALKHIDEDNSASGL